MTPDEHAAFTAALERRLIGEDDVLGLVMLGSSSGIPPGPDPFSDHDFFVVTHMGRQEAWRNARWLPGAERIVLSFRETAHGVKALRDDGHLFEFAVFDPDEIGLARVNRYRVVFDRADVGTRMGRIRDLTAAAPAPDPGWHMGQFLTQLVVAAGRTARGERLSGTGRIWDAAHHLLVLLRTRLPAEAAAWLDNLDPTRRFEGVASGLAAEIEAATHMRPIAGARALLAVAVRELSDLVPAGAAEAVLKSTHTGPPG